MHQNLTYRRHQRIQDGNGESGAARKRLSEIQFGVRVVVVVLIQELNVAIVYKLYRKLNIVFCHIPNLSVLELNFNVPVIIGTFDP